MRSTLVAGKRIKPMLAGMCFLMLLFASVAHSKTVQFAGLAFLGDYQDLDSRFRHVRAAFGELDTAALEVNKSLGDLLEKSNFKVGGYLLNVDGLASFNETTLAVALGLQDVAVDTVPFNQNWLHRYHIEGQVLLFDFDEMRIEASYPYRTTFEDSSTSERPASKHSAVIRQLLTSSDSDSVIDIWRQLLATRDTSSNEKRINYGVRTITIDSSIIELAKSKGVGESALIATTAQRFASMLGGYFEIPIVPYTTGQAIGVKMAGRFSDSKIYQLQIPERDVAIDLNIPAFFYRTNQTKTRDEFLSAAYAEVRFEDELINGKKSSRHQVYLDARFRTIDLRKFARVANVKLDKWQHTNESQLALFAQIVKQIKSRDRAALKDMSKTKGVSKQLKNLCKQIEGCSS